MHLLKILGKIDSAVKSARLHFADRILMDPVIFHHSEKGGNHSGPVGPCGAVNEDGLACWVADDFHDAVKIFGLSEAGSRHRNGDGLGTVLSGDRLLPLVVFVGIELNDGTDVELLDRRLEVFGFELADTIEGPFANDGNVFGEVFESKLVHGLIDKEKAARR